MSLRQEFLQPARNASRVQTVELRGMGDAILSGQKRDGGFAFPGAKTSSCIQTAWALEALTALREELPVKEVRQFLEAVKQEQHEVAIAEFAGLVRCWLHYPKELENGVRLELVEQLRRFSTPQGFVEQPGQDLVSVGAQYWGMAAAQELGVAPPPAERLLAALEGCRDAETGAYCNNRREVSLLATSQAVSIYRQLGKSIDQAVVTALLERTEDEHGGFRDYCEELSPDVRTTAHALHLAAAVRASLLRKKAMLLDYLEAMRVAGGAFCRDWSHGDPDAESTFHGLVALGHLAS